ncbi:cupin domain-containing protein [Spirosoma spitsbergense]|uniref:cupin domain-containing protein n=1 Tax=Spirosoma spitsbergense TaxID=431554 RepID=UPI00248092FF|nr:cupin domain-containing protein [Spirosoma spitsbergense]
MEKSGLMFGALCFSAGAESPLHLHTKYSELIYVLEGEFTIYTDTGVATLSPGGSVFIPINTQHMVVGSGEGDNRAITVASPSGFAELIRSVGTPGSFDSIPPDQSNEMSLFLKLSEEIGDVLWGPPGTRPAMKIV